MFFSHPHSIFHGVKKSMKSPFSTKNSWPFHGGGPHQLNWSAATFLYFSSSFFCSAFSLVAFARLDPEPLPLSSLTTTSSAALTLAPFSAFSSAPVSFACVSFASNDRLVPTFVVCFCECMRPYHPRVAVLLQLQHTSRSRNWSHSELALSPCCLHLTRTFFLVQHRFCHPCSPAVVQEH
jgi:hypothetical protein